ncbi:MAG: 1-acyl-sn-glycerol-3-phosphate acyltransferase [Candidatus Azobacteroides sp.]|nr:1-acyl-sn-glycerol-3-phosphate acyltransferase [Candidatus Azobacteroides sp.]
MADKYPVQLDIAQIIKDKAPDKKIPVFLIKFLEKTICQEGLNAVLRFAGENEGHRFAVKALEYFNITLNVTGEENIPSEGRFVFASNHPLGGLDGIALAAFLGQKYNGKIKVQVNDLLMNVKNLEPIFLPVNKHGVQAKEFIARTNESFASEDQILVFPAGLCSRKIKGRIQDPDWKKAFISKAIEYKRGIVPVFFDEKNSNFFYNLAFVRSLLGIKFNIEMLYLPKEMFKKKNATFDIHIGEPIAHDFFDQSKTSQQWAEYVKDVVYKSGKNLK